MIPALAGRLAIHLTRYAHRHGVHRYLSTGCLHGDEVLPDGRTGHQYCQGNTGQAGAKTPGVCKVCGAPCVCRQCHRIRPANPKPEA